MVEMSKVKKVRYELSLVGDKTNFIRNSATIQFNYIPEKSSHLDVC